MRKKILLPGLVVFLVVIGMGISLYHFFHPDYLKTERFIRNYMTNSNGTLATYLTDTPEVSPDLAHGREALSESLGLRMQYAVERKDREQFEQSYLLLQQYFLNKKGFIYWKISPDGAAEVATNALIDDLRIVDALFSGEQVWNRQEWGETAKEVGRTMAADLTKEGLLVDFYDSRHHNSADSLTLSYLNPRPLEKLAQYGILNYAIYDRSLRLIRDIPNDGVFFPKEYDVKGKSYRYDSSINLIDQLLIALNRAYLGVPAPELYTFIKDNFYQNGILYGRYSRETRTAERAFESPAVYAIAIFYSLEIGDTGFAVDLYKQMIRLRKKSGMYAGGYVSDNSTHIFDNLYPELAELKLYEVRPWFFLFSL